MTQVTWTPLPGTGAAALGEPPVALRQIARALERARGSASQQHQALAAAFPQLDAEQLAAAQTRIELEPGAAVGAASPRVLASLALARGLGLTLCAPGVLGLLALALAVSLPTPPDVERAGLLLQAAGGAALLLLGWVPGVGLLRGKPWANAPAAALAWLAVLLYGGTHGLTWGVLPLGLLSLGLLRDPLGRWQTPSWQASARSLAVAPYLSGVAVGLVVLASLPLAGRLQEVFHSMGVELPWITEQFLWLSETFQGPLGLLFLPAVLLAPAPLLRIGPSLERTATWAGWTAAVLTAWACVGAIFLPIFELQRALAQ